MNSEWGHLNMICAVKNAEPESGSAEAFIRDHYWGYTTKGKNKTAEFRIEHRPWKIYMADRYEQSINVGEIYGQEFTRYFQQQPLSAFFMDGSFTKVSWPALL